MKKTKDVLLQIGQLVLATPAVVIGGIAVGVGGSICACGALIYVGVKMLTD